MSDEAFTAVVYDRPANAPVTRTELDALAAVHTLTRARTAARTAERRAALLRADGPPTPAEVAHLDAIHAACRETARRRRLGRG